MQRLLHSLALAVFMVGTSTTAQAQSPASTLQSDAEAALVAGDTEQAVRLSQDLNAMAPDSFAGAFLLALSQDAAGNYPAAADAAAQAYRTAPTQADKLRAAQLAGTAWFKANAFTRAEFWLRRAANHIESEEEARAVVLAFQRAQNANPLSVRISGWAAPSDNINNGADDATFQLEGVPFDFILPPERRALSGVEFAAGAQLSYRLSQNERQRTTAGAYVFGQSYVLTEASKDILPDADVSDFALGVAEISLAHERQFFPSLGLSGISGGVGRFWYGGNPVWDYATVSLHQSFVLPDRDLLTLRATGTQQTPLFDGPSDVRIRDVGATLARTLTSNDVLQLSLAHTYSDGGFENVFSEYRIGARYDISAPQWNTLWSGSATFGTRNYDTFATTLDGRRDTFGNIGVDVVFQEISYWGFSPKLSINATRTRSSAEEFNSSGVQGRFGIESNF
jgi:hypothetical protein